VKTAVILAVVTIMAIPVVAEVIALSDTANFPMASAVPSPGKIGLIVPPYLPAAQPPAEGLVPHLVEPGIYEVQPFTTMLKVPNPTADHCVIHASVPSAASVLQPELKIVPKILPLSQAQK
jgi:hypothetical protein